MTIVVGAGLAGLTCAKVLSEAGEPFLLLEAAARPGGRVVSDLSPEGFILDRGFQVLLDSYPAARRRLDFPALGGGYFRAGAMFVGEGRPRVLENPLRRPSAVFAALRGDVLSVLDQFRLLRLAALSFMPRAGAGVSTANLLHSQHFGEEFFARFARPFFGGVLLDPQLETSAELFLGYLRRFVGGRAMLPAKGIGGISEQLAARLPGQSVRYNARVDGLLFENGCACGVRLGGGEAIKAKSVVLAVDEPAVCLLLGSGRPRAARSTAVHYFAAGRAAYSGGWLCLPPRRAECPVLHAALVSNVAPSVAPEGEHLWSVTVLPEHAQANDADAVAVEVESWFGPAAGKLRHLSFVSVPYAVPEQLPGFERCPAPWGALPPGLFVAGDSACGASIDAVMASGEAAAKKVILSGALN